MKNERARSLLLGAVLAMAAFATAAADVPETQTPGRLRVAVYADFPPYSSKGKGIDIELGKELAKRMGLEPEVVEYAADEDMNDDLRNMVWKGHYLGTRPADVMLHVPVDKYLADNNEQVKIFGPYHLESLAVARNPKQIPPVTGSAARALEIFTREKIGVETASLADDFLLSVLNGRLRENVLHFTNVGLAVQALKDGQVGAVMAARTEVESALGAGTPFEISQVSMPELRIKGWALGMAVKAGNDPLAEALGKAMQEIDRDGTLARIFADNGATLQKP
ncbi:substrate-binding periplasmic protein [Cognatazoarcus halotolerans]|uniref:substrate-binding periplasmic protein n=1 Tax=Cognatazoarcus halotolerans TaxID=2686016 RepID=UPI001359BFC6|nr:transporter substrate-binding domain-containing protein [Cognatazoarcus halotolerans]MCB1900178.1 transporter substrate-binding domain-containing protein [Rhodocyclaceae bacterium]MCP5308630.1 transporter substrate-binding domain-containing protein [Zoogloeaceae bacterium]